MSGLLSMRRAAAPRHSSRTTRPDYQRRVRLNRFGIVAKNIGLVLVAVVVLFSAVFLVLAVTSWASEHDTGHSAGTVF